MDLSDARILEGTRRPIPGEVEAVPSARYAPVEGSGDTLTIISAQNP